ncbi:hypothetical protein KOI35_31785 [Actinoplanes bogorensis]|uniref:Uncharacterized protein n=1 Tax=Paractinoplanes bogorensis TaxID=1610840 RepID=A0ABS5YXP5_9ACTN|nr:hypothetical protein [Actinoplanes bogorensis]MBU2668101.1 hypothetical protein [Actinoplanes bogorensis]
MLVRRLVAAAVLAGSIAACHAPPAPPPPAAAPPVTTLPLSGRAAIGDLLADSLVLGTARTGGYFVDHAWSVRQSPFSLYETAWQSRWRPTIPAGVQRDRLAPWLAEAAAGTPGSSTLQRIGQISLATGTARRLGLPVDGARVAAALAALRQGDRYAPDPGTTANWGSTAAAVSAMTDARLPVPGPIVTSARAELDRLPDRLPPDTIVGTAIPLLEIVTTAGSSPDSAPRVAGAALDGLNRLAPGQVDAAWLGARHQLDGVRAALGQARAPIGAAYCAALVDRDGHVTLPGETTADTQAGFYAHELGCRAAVAPDRPYTRAGWISGAVSDPHESLAATNAALRLAAALGDEKKAASAVRPSVSTRWLPLLAQPGRNGGGVDAARLLAVARSTGALSPSVRDRAAAALTTLPEGSLPQLLSAGSLDSGIRVRAARAALAGSARPGAADTIETATLLALAGSYLGDRALTGRGAEVAARLQRPHQVYAAGPCAAECEFSPLASALGNWISRTAEPPRAAWERQNLCQGYRCGGSGSDGTTLQEVYVALICDRPGCGSEIPWIL